MKTKEKGRSRPYVNTNIISRKRKEKKNIYLEDFSALETELVIGGGFKIVFGDGLHGYYCELRKTAWLWLCLRDLIKKK